MAHDDHGGTESTAAHTESEPVMAHIFSPQSISRDRGTTRREFLRSGGLALGALHVGGMSSLTGNSRLGQLQAGESGVRRSAGRAKSVILFNLLGGGITPGAVYGETDAIAAYPKSHPVSPADIVATIYQQLGIASHTMLPDRAGRPMPIAHCGQPIPGLT